MGEMGYQACLGLSLALLLCSSFLLLSPASYMHILLAPRLPIPFISTRPLPCDALDWRELEEGGGVR